MRKSVILFVFSILFITSCTFQKKLYSPGFYVSGKSSNEVPAKETKPGNKQLNIEDETENQPEMSASAEKLESPCNNFSAIVTPIVKPTPKFLLEECDIITLKTGEEIKCHVTEIALNEIKYKKCDNLTGPTISIAKSDVFMIKYPNGTKDIITTSQQPSAKTATSNNTASKNVNGFAVAGFILALIAGTVFLLVSIGLGIACAILAIIFSSIAIARIKHHSDTQKGKGLAIAGLIIGIIGFIGSVISYILLNRYSL